MNLSVARAYSIWFTGLSGSGKTTLAIEFRKILAENDLFTIIMDGDEIRKGLNSNLGFTEVDRLENIRRVAEVSKLLVNNGIITINAFICPTNNMRNLAKDIVGDLNFQLVYLDAPIDICEKRDTKGMYKKARNGELKNFSGISAPFEKPENPDLILNTSTNDIRECTIILEKWIRPLISVLKVKL